jgi:TetR/AcrR family transcriptional regulator, lmrAB and yxaGH operons repressor
MATDTRDRLLDAASRLIQQRGYHGTSVSEILEESGAPKGSLYFHFPGGKNQLVTEAARISVERSTQWLRETFSNMKEPAKGVRDLFATYAAIMRETNFTFGCLESALVLDSVAGLSEVEELCKHSFEEAINGFLRYVPDHSHC